MRARCESRSPTSILPGAWGARPPLRDEVVRRSRFNVMFLPILDAEDGYGFTYGAQFAFAGRRSTRRRVVVPASWGGDKRIAAEYPAGVFAAFRTAAASRRDPSDAARIRSSMRTQTANACGDGASGGFSRRSCRRRARVAVVVARRPEGRREVGWRRCDRRHESRSADAAQRDLRSLSDRAAALLIVRTRRSEPRSTRTATWASTAGPFGASSRARRFQRARARILQIDARGLPQSARVSGRPRRRRHARRGLGGAAHSDDILRCAWRGSGSASSSMPARPTTRGNASAIGNWKRASGGGSGRPLRCSASASRLPRGIGSGMRAHVGAGLTF